ncbi:MAG: hypothetical protein JXK95_10230 [Bacteroidales bacterium]|nr:hypothetical protein [Bacteroidales bacterium]
MKTARLIRPVKNIFLRILTVVMLFSVTACVKKIKFQTSAVVPAATGYVYIKSDENKNYVIRFSISNLAEISRIQPSRQTYVVWLVSDQEKTVNIGLLESSAGFPSKQLKASFETVTSHKPTKIFISAENNGNVQYPGKLMVLTTNKFRINR